MMLKDTANDRELVLEIVVGNEQAFSILFFRYLPILQLFATKFAKSEDAAQEIIQDAFVRIWLSRDRLAEVENVKAYLYKFVSNECLSYLRKKLREEKLADSFALKQVDTDNNTLEQINLNEINKIIALAIEKLPAQRKRIYQLSRGEGKTIPQIAEILNVSPSTVKNALVISLKFIRNQLAAHGIIFIWFLMLLLFTLK